MHIFLQALAILTFISLTLTDLTLEQLQQSFNVRMDNFYGGSCNRNSLADGPMLPKVLNAFEDAWLLSASGVEIPPVQINARSDDLEQEAMFTRLRATLFGFFGINLTSTGLFADDLYSEWAYYTFQSKLSDPISFDKSACRLTSMK